MWEFALIGENSDKKDFEDFKNNINKTLCLAGGACTIVNEGDELCLLIACPKNIQGKITQNLDNFIVKKILYGYKKDYFNKNLKIFFTKKYQKVAIDALVKFDYEFDVMHIFKNLDYQNELRLKSFLIFKLKTLTSKWKDICEVTRQNSAFLKSETACQELIKFLLKNS